MERRRRDLFGSIFKEGEKSVQISIDGDRATIRWATFHPNSVVVSSRKFLTRVRKRVAQSKIQSALESKRDTVGGATCPSYKITSLEISSWIRKVWIVRNVRPRLSKPRIYRDFIRDEADL